MKGEMYVICVNCGKQVLVVLDSDICYFCSKLALKKEENMVMPNVELPPVPPKPNADGLNLHARLKAISAYYEANKAAIIKEWQDSGKPNKLERWHIGYASLRGLLERWGLILKARKKAKIEKEAKTAKVLASGSPTSDAPDYKRLYELLQERFIGYQQAVRDIFCQSYVDGENKKTA